MPRKYRRGFERRLLVLYICFPAPKSNVSHQIPLETCKLLCPFIVTLPNFFKADESELEIVREGGLSPILEGARSSSIDLKSQCARALRNLSVNREYIFPCI